MDLWLERGFALLQDRDELIHLINKLLSDLLGETRALPKQQSGFDCKDVPSISILDYLKRIGKYSRCSSSVFIAALIYMDRWQQRLQNFIINDYNIHRLLISCLMVAAKYLDDFYYKNEFYAKIGGITKTDLNVLELQLLEVFQFSMFIREEEFISYLSRVESYRQVNV